MTEDRTEIPKPHEYYLELARTLPQVPVEDPGVQQVIAAKQRGERFIPKGWGPYGNNFYILFDGLRMDRSSPRYQRSLQRSDVERAEALGEPWQRFLRDNEGLLTEINMVFEEGSPYQELEGYIFDLVNSRQRDKIEELDKATGHPLGLSSLQQAYWNRMNPLLERAAQGMQVAGIDTQQRYGLP